MKLNAKLSKRESQIAELLAWGASKKVGKNAHDDAPDALTGTIEKRSGKPQKLSNIFP